MRRKCSIHYLFLQQNLVYLKQKVEIRKNKKQMHKKSKQWTSQEIKLLKAIKNKHKQKKWKNISKDFCKRGLERTQHECRNKWVNCLDPQINHKPWAEEELKLLYTEYEKHHSQWSLIQKSLPNRTQIKIKNHFYGVLRNITRSILKYFKEVPSQESKFSNRINPNYLQLMYKGEKQYSYLGDIIRSSIRKMDYRFSKQKINPIIEQNLEIFRKLNKEILEEIKNSSDQYEEHGSSQYEKRQDQPNYQHTRNNCQKAIEFNYGYLNQDYKVSYQQSIFPIFHTEIPQFSSTPLVIYNGPLKYIQKYENFEPAADFALLPCQSSAVQAVNFNYIYGGPFL